MLMLKILSAYHELPCSNLLENLNSGVFFSLITNKRCWGSTLITSLDFHTPCTETFLQTTQGVQINCFRTLEDLVLGYQHPHKGLVSTLLYGVPRDTDSGDESSGAPSGCYHVTSPGSLITFYVLYN